MSGLIRKITIIMTSVLVCFAAAACGETAEPLMILSEGQTAYQIVRSDIGDAAAAVALRNSVRDTTGTELKLTTDFESEKSGTLRIDTEITVGTTNRGESAALTEALRYDDYVIKTEGMRVHITGGSVDATLAAVTRFCEEFVTAEGITVAGDCDIRHAGSYAYDELTLAGNSIKDYVIITSSDNAKKELAGRLSDAILAATGYKLPVEGLRYDGGKNAIVMASSGYGESASFEGKGKDNEYGAAYRDGDIYLYKTGALVNDSGMINWFIEHLKVTPEVSEVKNMSKAALTDSELNVTKTAEYGFEIATDAIMAEIDKQADAMKTKILTSKSTVKPAAGGTAYYVSNDGSDTNDGKTPETAWKTLAKVGSADLKAGDVVYLRRGDLFRGQMNAKAGVTYSAYGEGDKPIITVSPYDGVTTGKWEKTDVENVYRFSERIVEDVGLLVFNHGESYAIKVAAVFNTETGKPVSDHATKLAFTGMKDLPGDLFYYHDLGGANTTSPDANSGYIYLRSDKGNPAERFDSIEFTRRLSAVPIKGNNVTIDNLSIQYSNFGVSSGTVTNLTVQNCEFGWIGGCLQNVNGGTPVRYGNGIEIYGSCHGYIVKDCYFHDVYDAGVTHQQKGTGAKNPYIMEDILYDANLFENCIYSIEYFNDQADRDDNIMRNMTISNNICRNAGGFGWQRYNKVARHIQGGWLNNKREYPAENYVVKNNIFDRSCDVLLSVSSTDIKDMPIMEGNTYIQNLGGNFGMVGVPYDRYYPYDSEIENVIKNIAGDADARIIMIVDDVKSTCEPDYHVMDCYANVPALAK